MLLKENIPFKYVFGKIRKEITLITVYVTAILIIHDFFRVSHISIPLSVPMILGTVISLLLGFRSNQAYDRWWEARIIWGAIVNDSRTLARQALTFIDNPYNDEEIQYFREQFIKRQIAWTYSLGQFLRNQDATKGLEKWLSRADLEYIAHYANAPAALLELQARDLNTALKQNWINEYQQVELDRTLSRLCDCMGKCERIKNTVFPATYSLYIHLSMNLFILLLPFALINFFGYVMIPLVIAIAATFFLIEKMAIHLQDPFENKPTDTPMTTIARNIERDLRQMLREHTLMDQVAVAEPVAREDRFYVL